MNRATIERLGTLTAAYRVHQKVCELEWIRAFEALVEEGGVPVHHGVVDGVVVSSVPITGLSVWNGRSAILW